MKRPMVRCRCGHRILAKEVLRTDLYERPSGREYVYVKYRCQRCKRMGETFVAESSWDWRIFQASRDELSESEAELFSRRAPISSEDVIDLHRNLTSTESLRHLVEETTSNEKTTPLDNTDAAPKTIAETKPGRKKSPEQTPKKTPRSEDETPR